MDLLLIWIFARYYYDTYEFISFIHERLVTHSQRDLLPPRLADPFLWIPNYEPRSTPDAVVLGPPSVSYSSHRIRRVPRRSHYYHGE